MAESIKERSWVGKPPASRVLRWGVGMPVFLVLVLYGASYLLDEPLRSNTEMKLNRDLKGYSVTLSGVHVQLIGFSATLKGLTVLQQAHPDAPVAHFPVVTASINWRGLLAGRLVGEMTLDRPKININLLQLRSETARGISLKARGWPQALENIYPLKINTLKINDASIIYIDQDPKKPLVLSHLNLQADNIRNIHLPDQVYPSSFHLDTAIFGTGRGTFDGAANFLVLPYPGIKCRLQLENVPIDRIGTLAVRSNLSLHSGLLRASGEAEYSPKVNNVHLEDLTIRGMKMDYIHAQKAIRAGKKRAAMVGKTARKRNNEPDFLLHADQVSLVGCTLGMVNEAAHKPYRVFLADTNIHLSNFSNQFSRGPAQARLKAKFMGSGSTTASATFRPEKAGPDFDLYLTIGQTQLTAMNNVLRAYGNFDVSAGVFSLVTELHVRNGRISGYIKPFFKDIKVYDRRKDRGRGFGHQMYEMLIGGVAKLLEKRSQQEVTTRMEISSPVGNSETSIWQIVAHFFKNAFLKAILPNFDKEATGAGKR
jgi:hypothetical protein